MMTNSHSSLEEIKSILLQDNPFNEISIRYQNIWGNEFLDVPSLNAHASDAVFQALEQRRTTSMVITAEYGRGKSHIISRIRHRLQAQNGALFVYANKYGDLSQIKQVFQAILADSLKQIGHQSVKQWQELATAMANQVLKANKKNPVTPKQIINKFNQLEPKQVKQWIQKFTNGFLQLQEVDNPDIVQAIFWTLSNSQISYAVNWLAGQELAQFKANELHLPTQNNSFDSVLQTLNLISKYYQIVICFDELDSPELDTDTGLTRAQVVAGFIKELFENLNNGVILSVMLPTVWQDKIKPMLDLSWRKVSDFGQPIDLKLLDEESTIQLVKQRLDNCYTKYNLIPPNEIYPFDEQELRSIGNKSSTVREVINWCKEQIPNKLNNLYSSQDDPVEIAFNEEMKEDISNYLDDQYSLAQAILFGFKTIIGKTVERVTVIDVTEKVKNNYKDNYINFKIIGKEKDKDVIIGVAVLQNTGGKGLGAGLSRLNDYDTFGLTRGCLVRSRDRKISYHLENKYLEPLVKQKGGEYVELKEAEIKPLIAIYNVYQKRTVDYQLEEQEIFDFIANQAPETMLGIYNALLQEILSDPSYQVPTDMIEDEVITEIESENLSSNDTDFNGDFDSIEEGINNLLANLK